MIYCATILPFTPPPLTRDFTVAIQQAPTASNGSSYWEYFVAQFGTHVATAVQMGGKYGQRSEFTSENYQEMQSENVEVNFAAGYSAMVAAGMVNAMTDAQVQMAQQFTQSSTYQYVFSVGGRPPADGQASTWAANSTIDPMPLSYTLQEISSLLTPIYFPQDEDIKLKQV